jgi:hypothetical protein
MLQRKSQIQALERAQPVFPMDLGQPERRTGNYLQYTPAGACTGRWPRSSAHLRGETVRPESRTENVGQNMKSWVWILTWLAA